MHRVSETSLWVGHAGDAGDLSALYEREIGAVVELAREEPAPALGRELIVLRFPLVDGPGNPPWTLRMAVESVSRLVSEGVSILVSCGGGMSRSPAIAAAALARVWGCSMEEALEAVVRSAPSDVTPVFWAEVLGAVGSP